MLILLIGGNGFVGRHLAARLSAAGHHLLIPTRRASRARELLVLPTARVVEADVHDERQLDRLMSGADAVVNLVGILKGDFERAHVRLPGLIGQIARRHGLARLIHLSALKAAPDAPSAYLRSKAQGEAALHAALPAAVILQPSVIFGQGDSFLNLFAALHALLPPYFPLPLACPDAQFQPVWVGDVVEVIQRALNDPGCAGQSWPLCGPQRYSLRHLVRLAGEAAGHPHPILGLSPVLSWLQAAVLQAIGGPMTLDNLRSMELPSVCTAGLPYGLVATPIEAVLPAMFAVGH